MDYQDLAGYIPLAHIIQALDDDGDGAADASAWTLVQAAAGRRITDAFGGTVPDTYSDALEYAREIFLCELLFDRRGLSDTSNPFTKKATDQEARLRKLANGEVSVEGAGAGVVISKPANIANMEQYIT